MTHATFPPGRWTAAFILLLLAASACPLPGHEPQPAPGQPATCAAEVPWAWGVFEDLREQGQTVLYLGRERKLTGAFRDTWELYAKLPLRIPPDVRGPKVEAERLVKGVAAFHGLQVHRAGAYWILYRGAPDDQVEELRKGFAADDPLRREEAAWRAGWAEDVRVIPWLVVALDDKTKDVAFQAERSLRRLGLDAAAALAGDKAEPVWKLLAADSIRLGGDMRKTRTLLGNVGGKRAYEILAGRQDADAPAIPPAIEPDKLKELARMDGPRTLRGCEALWPAAAREALRQKYSAAQVLLLLKHGLLDGQGAVRGFPERVFNRPGRGFDAAQVKAGLAGGDADKLAPVHAAMQLGFARWDDQTRELYLLAMKSGDRTVRNNAVSSLGDMADPRVVPLVAAAFGDTDDWVRRGAASVAALYGVEKFLPQLEGLLREQKDHARRHVLDVLATSNHPAAIALLRKCLTHEQLDVRAHVLYGLAENLGPEALPAIEQALKDQTTRVRLAATETLSIVGGRPALPLLERAFDDKEVEIKTWAVRFAGRLRGSEVTALLVRGTVHPDKLVRSVAVQQLAFSRMDPEQAFPALVKALEDREADVRKYAAVSLGFAGRAGSRDALSKALNDQEPQVRVCAAHALGRLKDEKAPYVLLERLKKEHDPRVRAAIMLYLDQNNPDVAGVLKTLPPIPTGTKVERPPVKPPEDEF